MELSRRDAVAALGALGAVAAAGCLQQDATGDEEGGEESVRETMVAAAEALYPSTVDGDDGFVETSLAGRLDDGPHAEGVREAVDALETRAEAWYDGRVAALDVDERDALLRETGA